MEPSLKLNEHFKDFIYFKTLKQSIIINLFYIDWRSIFKFYFLIEYSTVVFVYDKVLRYFSQQKSVRKYKPLQKYIIIVIMLLKSIILLIYTKFSLLNSYKEKIIFLSFGDSKAVLL